MSSGPPQPPRGPLSHIRVLDLSRVVAGPWATQILGDLGAEVIKIERPGAGDDTRGWGPPFLKDSEGRDTREAGYYLSVNRAKRSVTVNLDSADGQALVRRLAARCDVVIENFKVGSLARHGLDYASLRAVNPRIVYASITGYGQTGPKSGLAAYDFAIQGMGGLMSVTGERDDRPGGGPQKVGLPIVDLTTGLYAVIGILAALARRAETGEGEYVDVAMLDVATAMLSNQAMNFLVGGRTPVRTGNAHPNIQPQDVFACRDGALVLAVGNDGQFGKLCGVLGRPELARDRRFASNAARVRNNALLQPLLAGLFVQRDRAEWVAALDAAGVPCGPINTVPEVFADPQVRHRGMRVDLPHPLSGSVPSVASPLRLANAPVRYERAPPLLGQHTDEVLREAGVDTEELARLRARGVI